jgi:hypothetical protein
VNKEGNLLPRPTRKEQVVKKYIVDLVEHERDELEQLSTKGISGARKIRRARILLLAEEGRIDKEIASFLGSAVTTVERVRKRSLSRRGLRPRFLRGRGRERPVNSIAARRLSLWRWPAVRLPKARRIGP